MNKLLFVILVISSIIFAENSKKKNNTRNLETYPIKKIESSLLSSAPTSVLFESFESSVFPPQGWVKIKQRVGGGGWSRELVGKTPVPGWTEGIITAPPVAGANTAVAFITYDTVQNFNDFWLVTSKITDVKPTDNFSFWLRKLTKFYSDTLEVKILLSINNSDSVLLYKDLAVIGFAPNQDSLKWTKFQYNIGSIVPAGMNIFIAFREILDDNINNGGAFFLDLVSYSDDPLGVTDKSTNPSAFSLEQNYPNPFNPSTSIKFNLPFNSNVELTVYNLLGEKVSTIFSGSLSAGTHDFSFMASNLASGIYLYKLSAKGSNGFSFVNIKKMILMK